MARVCLAIRAAPEKAFDFTYLGRAVAIVTDGSAVLGLGNIGPRAGLPVIEGKAALLAALVGISGIPILIESGAVDHFVDVVCAIAPSFGAILLEDISAPRCFEIEQKLRARLPIPVLHDDQHVTAVVVLAALLNATRQIGTTLDALTVGVIGLGAAGLGIARLLHAHGVKRLLGTDLRAEAMGRLAQLHGHGETLERILAQADAVICTTGVKGLMPLSASEPARSSLHCPIPTPRSIRPPRSPRARPSLPTARASTTCCVSRGSSMGRCARTRAHSRKRCWWRRRGHSPPRRPPGNSYPIHWICQFMRRSRRPCRRWHARNCAMAMHACTEKGSSMGMVNRLGVLISATGRRTHPRPG